MRYFDTFTGIGGFTLGIQQAYEDYICSRHGKYKKRYGESNASQQSIQTTNEDTQRSGNPSGVISTRNSRKVLCNADRSENGGQPNCVGYSEIDKYATQIYQRHYPNHTNYGDITKINTAELPDFDLLVGGFPCQAFSVAGKRKGFEDTRGTLFFDLARILRDKRPRYFIFENVKGLLSHDSGKTFQTILETLTDIGYEHQWQLLNSKDFGVPQNRERIYIVGHLRGERRLQVFPIEGITGKNLEELTSGVSQGYRVYDSKGISTTLASQAGGLGAKTGLHQLKDSKIRRLTPLECERLQGFPDGWTEGVSDTQRYKCLGNAVTVNVVKEIVKKMV